MKQFFAFALIFLFASSAAAQHFEGVQPSGRKRGGLFAAPRGVAGEVAATARDFATFRDKQWEILTFAQIGAATADAQTSLYNIRNDPSIREIGVSRFFIGSRPDAHKYIVAGLVEITLEATAGHYLRNHGPVQKWYWRAVWTLPQSFALYEHTRASIHNVREPLSCDAAGQQCH